MYFEIEMQKKDTWGVLAKNRAFSQKPTCKIRVYFGDKIEVIAYIVGPISYRGICYYFSYI